MKYIGTRILITASIILAGCTSPVRQTKKEGSGPPRGHEIEKYEPNCSRATGLILENTRVETLRKMPWGSTITYEQDPSTRWLLQLRGSYDIEGNGINGVQYYCGPDGEVEETQVNGEGNAEFEVKDPSIGRSFKVIFTEQAQ